MTTGQQTETNHALKRIQPLLPNLEEAPLPPAVYHYTDASGLQGILSTGVLWATDYRYLNDSSELRYIFRLATQAVESQLRSKNHGALAEAFLEYVSTTAPPYGDTVYYLCCFSESDNSLSQWRAYGGRQGFSLCFPGDITLVDITAMTRRPPRFPNMPQPVVGQGQSAGVTLLRVDYDTHRHVEYVTRLIAELLELCESEHMRSYTDPQLAISHITPFYFAQLERASYRFKHPDFADEREWRLVSWAKQTEYFRVGATLTPYAKVHLFSASHPNTHGLPLLAVRYGPTALPEETKLAMDRLLTSCGYAAAYCERRGSDTPVRL